MNFGWSSDLVRAGMWGWSAGEGWGSDGLLIWPELEYGGWSAGKGWASDGLLIWPELEYGGWSAGKGGTGGCGWYGFRWRLRMRISPWALIYHSEDERMSLGVGLGFGEKMRHGAILRAFWRIS